VARHSRLLIFCVNVLFALILYVYTQAFDTKRSDFWQHFVHHLVTMALITLSWVTNFVRMGTLVMLIHDISDVPLEVAKVSAALYTLLILSCTHSRSSHCVCRVS
jgi:TLC domain